MQRNLPEYVLSNFENSLSSATQNIEKLAILTQLQHKAFQKRKGQMGFFIQTKKVFLVEMQNILVPLRSERQLMNILKKKMKRLAAEKRCLTALPKCQRILTISHGAASAPTPARRAEASYLFSSLSLKTKIRKVTHVVSQIKTIFSFWSLTKKEK